MMRNTYRKPLMVHYNREEIMEMIGPVKTNYCQCQNSVVQPITKQSTSLDITVTTPGPCADYERVIVQIPGTDPFLFINVPRSEGTEIGNQWSYSKSIPQYLGDPGVFTVEVDLTDASGDNTIFSCDTTVIIQ